MSDQEEEDHGFELHEEEFDNDGDNEETTLPQQWWSVVNELTGDGDGDSDGLMCETDLDSLCGDEEEKITRTSKREYNPRKNPVDFKFKIGMEFPSIEQLRDVLVEEFIKSDREFHYVFNDKSRLRAKCKAVGCQWVLYAKIKGEDNRTVRINTLIDTHNCGIVFDNKLITSRWLVKHFLDDFRLNPSMDYSCFKEMVGSSKFSNVSRHTFYRARLFARDMLEGSVREQYAVLDDYCKQLTTTSPGTTTLLKTSLIDGKRVFERVYICLKACKDGFENGCRPLLGFDGCFLKDYCKGMLLAAIGVDANNSQYPVAFAVVEKENTITWTWFLMLLLEDLNVQNTSQYTMMSDRQKGLEKALADEFPGAESRFCVRHLHSNFKKQHTSLLLKQMLWDCARATTKTEFASRMNLLKDEDEKAHEWLLQKQPSQWTKSHFRFTPKCDMLLNNMCESFNAAIMPARGKPILTLLERIRYWLMCRFESKRVEVQKWVHAVGPRIIKVIENHKRTARNCQSTAAGNAKFQVTFLGIESFLVDLISKVCTCRLYQLTGIPCPHALTSIWSSGLDPMDYIDACYKKEAYMASYAGIIEPMTRPEKWPNAGLNPIFPPLDQTLPGRPKKKRNKHNDEIPHGFENVTRKKHSRKGQVNRCKQVGHSKKSCSNEASVQVYNC